MHHFVRKPEEYKRKLDPLAGYRRAAENYLSVRTGRSAEQINSFLDKTVDPTTGTHIKVPQMRVLVRGKNGDRAMQFMRFDHFLNDVVSRNRIIAPTMTVYEDPNVERSMLGEYLGDNLNRRKKAKHEMFQAEMAANYVLYAIKNAEQNTLKVKNNSMSGAHSSPYTILYNKSSHSTLTSTCRTATSLGNGNNEKLLCGNRHYYSEEIVRNNIVSICTLTNMDAVKGVLQRHNLRAPTVDEVMSMISRSSQMYWTDDEIMARLREDVEALNEYQRAAVMFVGDLYHTAVVNERFVRDMITEMAVKATTPIEGVDERKRIIKSLDANTSAFVSIVCAKECGGEQLKDIDPASHEYGIIAATSLKIIKALDTRIDFIKTFLVTDNMPSSVYYLPSIVRRGAITSDTDSTIFTVQWWPEWFTGSLKFDEISVAVANTLVYFSAETIRHLLAMYSANLGAEVKEIHRLSMKNEFYFPVFVLTSRAKHYFAYVAAQEGNVFSKMKTEIKGVALRSSNAPPAINDQAHALMRYIMDEVMAGRKISLSRILRACAKIELGIENDIKRGGFDLLQTMTIKSQDSYTNHLKSNWIHYDMWNRVFADKYGPAPTPPYVAIKVNLTTDNRSRMKEWLDTIPDRGIAERLVSWMEEYGRKEIAVMYMPYEQLSMHGIPEEVIPAANIRNLISITMTPIYLLLESIGYYVKNKHNTRLISDDRWLLADDWPHPEIDLLNY